MTTRPGVPAEAPVLQLLQLPALRVGPVRHPLAPKDAALLALLALEGSGARARVAALLWPDAAPKGAHNNLRQRLFRLRRIAACDVVVNGEALVLAPGVQHDLQDLRARLQVDVAAAGGELLGTHDYSGDAELALWVAVARERWRATRRDVVAELAERCEREERIADALAYAERLACDEPLLEHAQRRLMRLHYRRGDRGAALAVYERLKAALDEQLGETPSAETQRLVSLIEAAIELPVARPPAPASVLRPPRLIGRERECARIADVLARHRSVIVRGEPGIGKTRLMTDTAAAQGAYLYTQGRPGDGYLPYALLARWVRAVLDWRAARLPAGPDIPAWVRDELSRIAPELGAAPASALDPLRMQQAVRWLLGLADLPTVIVDDLHFADPATIEALPALLDAAGDGVRWMLGLRANEVPAALAEWLARHDADADLLIDLGPLDQAATCELLRSLQVTGLDADRWAAPLFRHTGGNPMFLLETLLMLMRTPAALAQPGADALPLPGSVGVLIGRRLQQLSPAALALARLAALAGPDFDVDLAARVSAKPALELSDTWRELEAAQVVRDDRFAHDLVLEATLRGIPAPIARALHREIAQLLEQRGTAPSRVAAHWRDADASMPAAEAFARAARLARAGSRRSDEVQLWHQAVACARAADDPRLAWALANESVDSLLLAGSVGDALGVTQRLLAEATDDRERCAASISHAHALLFAHRADDACVAAADALRLGQALKQARLEFDAARLLGLGLAQRGRAREGLQLLEPLAAWVEHQADRAAQYRYWADLSYMLRLSHQRRRAVDAVRRSVELAAHIGDLAEQATCTMNLAALRGDLGQPAAALSDAQRARLLMDRIGEADGVSAIAIDMHIGLFHLALGAYREALQFLGDAAQRFRSTGSAVWSATADNHLALAWLALGQFTRAKQALAPLDPSLRAATRARRRTIEARIAAALGQPSAALAREAAELADLARDPLVWCLATLECNEQLAPADAASHCATVVRRAEQAQYPGAALKARWLRVDALRRCGRPLHAARLARALLTRVDSTHPSDMHLPQIWWIAHGAFEATGDAAASAAALEAGARWIRTVALPHVADEFRASFIDRNAINRQLLAAAARRLAG